MRLAGRTAIVTGAASGIGRGIALAFALEGTSVVIADRTTSPRQGGAPTPQAIAAAGGTALYLQADVSRWADVDRGLMDGKRVRKLVRALRGHPDNPLTMADIEAKFSACIDGRIDPARGARILDVVGDLERLPSVRTLGALLGEPT